MVEFNGRNVALCVDEKAEPLGDGYYIIQSKSCYRFGADAVALAHFASEKIGCGDKVFELCSGCGIIGIMLAIERGCAVIGAEIDEKLCDMSVRSCELNGLDRVEFINADIRELNSLCRDGYDLVVCNPPYFKAGSKAGAFPQADMESTVTAADVVDAAGRLLKQHGTLYLVHTSSRLDEILCLCRDGGLMPKELVINGNGKTFMLRAVRGGKPGMTVRVGTK